MEKVFSPQNRKTSLTLLIFLGFITGSIPVFAQDQKSGLSLSPPFQEIIINRDQTESSFSLEVSNHEPIHQTFYLSVVDFGSLDKTGGVAFQGAQKTDFEIKYGLASWVILDKNILEIAPDGSGKVKVTIVNKDSLSPGGHYAAVVVRSNPLDREPGNIKFNYAFSTLIFVKKLGGEIYNLKLIPPKLSDNWFGLPSHIQVSFQNTGNVHVVPRGEVSLIGPFNRLIAKGVINQESGLILPETYRDYTTDLTTVNFPFLPGNYTLETKYRFEGQSDFTASSVSFFYIGLPFVITLSLIISLFLLFHAVRKRIPTKKKDLS